MAYARTKRPKQNQDEAGLKLTKRQLICFSLAAAVGFRPTCPAVEPSETARPFS